ncbi:MAG: hypothetical protein WDN49_25620 [Acetobacteraceae bacterium]
MDIVNYYLGGEGDAALAQHGSESAGADAAPARPSLARPQGVGASVVFAGALAYLGSGDASGSRGQSVAAPANGTTLDVTA